MLKIHSEYKTHGVENFYKKYSDIYSNPHEEKIAIIYKKYISNLIKKSDTILDIACGDGLISRLVLKYNGNNKVEGIDPFFTNKYVNYKMDFKDIICGKINKFYNISICSYAFHLIQKNMIYDFLTQLSLCCDKFIIISPSKKINISHPFWNNIKMVREDKITLIIMERKN